MIIQTPTFRPGLWTRVYRNDEPGADGSGESIDDLLGGEPLEAGGEDLGDGEVEGFQEGEQVDAELDAEGNPVPPADDADPAAKADEDDPEEVWKDGETEVRAKKSELRAAFAQMRDYTAKTTAIAEREREVQTYAQGLGTRMQQGMQAVNQAMQWLQQDLQSTAPSLELIQTNPQEYLRQKALHDQRVQGFQQIMATGQAVRSQQQQTTDEQRAMMLRSENEKVLAAIPEWRNPNARNAESAKIRSDLIARGFTAEEAGALTDHRTLLLARDAAKWREHESTKSKRAPVAAQPPARVVKPGAAMPQRANNGKAGLMQRLDRNPNDERALAGLIGLSG